MDQGLCHQLQLPKLLPKLPSMEPEVELASRHTGLVLVAFLAMVLELELDLEVQAKLLLLLPLPKLPSMVPEELEPWEAWCQVQYQVHCQVQCQVQCQVCRALVECQEQVPLRLQLLPPPPPRQLPKQASMVWALVLVAFPVELVLVGFPVELALVVLLVLELVLAPALYLVILEEQGHQLLPNLLLRRLPKPSTGLLLGLGLVSLDLGLVLVSPDLGPVLVDLGLVLVSLDLELEQVRKNPRIQ